MDTDEGASTMRVIVVCGSSRGGTTEIGRRIAEELVGRGLEADLGDAALVDDLTGHDAVVVGGALYYDRWHHDARQFVARQEATLRAMPVWFFSSGPLDTSATTGSLAPVDGVRALARRVEIREHMTFGGRLDRSTVGAVERVWARGRYGDFRDPRQIAEWSARITRSLTAAVSVADALPQPRRTSSTAGRRVSA
jgi:menaquinone-dependent protoporphyrinogen oxidase